MEHLTFTGVVWHSQVTALGALDPGHSHNLRSATTKLSQPRQQLLRRMLTDALLQLFGIHHRNCR